MSSFRFGRDPFRFDSNVFQPEARPEVWAPQKYQPTPRDNFSMSQQPAVEEPSQPAGTEKDLFDMQSAQVNEYPMMDKFSELLSQRPTREDYKPSVWRNIISAVGGVSSGMLGKPESAVANAYGTTEKLRDVPFDRATSDWSGKIAGYGEGAKMELQKADKENKFLAMTNNAFLNQAKKDRMEGQTLNEAERNRVKQQEVLGKIQNYSAQGWKPVKANGRVYMVKPGEDNIDVGEDIFAQVAQQDAATRERGERNRTALGYGNLGVAQGNLANQVTRTGIMQQDSNTRITQAQIAYMNAESTQDKNAMQYWGLQLAAEKFNEDMKQNVFNRTMQTLKYERGDDAPMMNPTQQNAAYDLAVKKVLYSNPGLVDVLGDNGLPSPDADPDQLDEFTWHVQQEFQKNIIDEKDRNLDPKTKLPTPGSPATAPPLPNRPRGGRFAPVTGVNQGTVTPNPAAGSTFLDFSKLRK